MKRGIIGQEKRASILGYSTEISHEIYIYIHIYMSVCLLEALTKYSYEKMRGLNCAA